MADEAETRIKVFISYSRADKAFASDLVLGLAACGFAPYIDRQDIAAGEVRIREQALRVETLRARGRDIDQAGRLLASFEVSLAQWQDHRVLIRERIVHLEELAVSGR